ncbi:MAG TPA: MBL fold metallo-hydrolase [Candidatus Dormibacteraeota bacterium]|nr:MBL fold metallo-hydrolase [Candidatus Dormibacteraeota bacterium]
MKNESLYLRPNIQVEPLVDHWYAWPHLIPPATAARNLTERHMKIMNSYVSSPQIHMNAVKNPKMQGGPFIALNGGRVDEVRSLRDRTKKERAHLFELSAAIGELDNMIRTKAKGFSLHPLYAEVPDILRGYVELVYDLNHQPSFRLIEPLLYRSRYYDPSMQSLMLSAIQSDDRPFVLSTPRLEDDYSVHLQIPFNSPVVDEIFRLKSFPRRREEIQEMLGLEGRPRELMSTFLTPEPPPDYVPYQGPGVRWRYFGHACILIESQGVSMLFDPVLSYTYEGGISRYTYLDLPDSIDYVLITHNHQDHVLFETLLQIRHKVKNIVVPRSGGGQLQDPSIKLLLEQCGFRNVIEATEMENVRTGNVQITALPFFGEHADLDIRSKMAWLVKIGPHAMMFAADSCNIEPRLYEHIHRDVGDVDALFVGMECDGAPLTWLYGPLLTTPTERVMDESRRLSGSNFEQARSIVELFNCKEVYVYAMGQEPWLNYITSIKYTSQSRPIIESDRLLKWSHERGITTERLFGEKEILIEDTPLTATDSTCEFISADEITSRVS